MVGVHAASDAGDNLFCCNNLDTAARAESDRISTGEFFDRVNTLQRFMHYRVATRNPRVFIDNRHRYWRGVLKMPPANLSGGEEVVPRFAGEPGSSPFSEIVYAYRLKSALQIDCRRKPRAS